MKEVACIYIFVIILRKSNFVMFSGLLVFLFAKLLYYTTYFFKNWTHFAPFFFFLCSA